MELWFIYALVGMLLAGVSNFIFKIAAAREYNGEVFSFVGGIISMIMLALVALLIGENLLKINSLGVLLFIGGMITSGTNIFKVQALKCIDATIYFSLFKLLAPALAILAGYFFFEERFTLLEWFGMGIGLIVPLLLISRQEDMRQKNLTLGLILVVVTAVTSALSAVIFKYGIDGGVLIISGLFYASTGITLGALCVSIYKNGTRKLIDKIKSQTSKDLVILTGIRSVLISTSFGAMLYSFQLGGTLAVVQTVNSFYILIPIVLAVIFYHEHINTQKVIAIILSVASLVLLG